MRCYLIIVSFIFAITLNPLFSQDLENVKEEKLLKQEQAKKEKELQILLEKAQLYKQKAQALSEKERLNVLEYFNQVDQNAIQRLNELRSTDPDKYSNQLNQLYFEKMYLERIQKEFPGRYENALEIRKLDSDSHQLAMDYRNEQDKNKKEHIENQLIKVLNDLFDLREVEKKMEMERVEEQLTQLSEEIDKRRENKSVIVQNRFKQLTGQNRIYEW